MNNEIWPDLRFPPINLWNVWPSPEMLQVDMEFRARLEGHLFGDDDDCSMG